MDIGQNMYNTDSMFIYILYVRDLNTTLNNKSRQQYC